MKKLVIEFEKELSASRLPNSYTARINGILDERSSCSVERGLFKIGKRASYIALRNEEAVSELIKYPLVDILEYSQRIAFDFICDWWPGDIHFSFSGTKKINTYLILNLRGAIWNSPWTINQFYASMKKVLQSKENSLLHTGDSFDDEYSFRELSRHFIFDCIGENATKGLFVIVNEILNTVKQVKAESEELLRSAINHDQLVTFFKFPDAIKISCKQYLIYFGQFLSDIGFESDVEVKEQANQTMFTIIPKDGNEALVKIREALEIYLNAPGSLGFEMQVSDNDVSIKQWEANIFHLKGQLALSTAVIQAKNATIESLHLSNYQYRQLIQDKITKEVKKEEDIIPGIVSVSKFEWKGISVNLAEIFRRMKRK